MEVIVIDFKKFLAPVMSCCCVVSSLVSHCSANYKYSDLYAVEITDYKGLNSTFDIEKLAKEDKIVYVSKELENLLKQDDRKCACCQNKMKLSEGFVISHDMGSLHRYDSWVENQLKKVLEEKIIDENTNIVKGFLNHLICKNCANEAFVKNRPIKEQNKPEENGLLRCPVCKWGDDGELGVSLRSLKFLGEAVDVQRKKNLKELRENLCNGIKLVSRIFVPLMMGLYLGDYLPDPKKAYTTAENGSDVDFDY